MRKTKAKLKPNNTDMRQNPKVTDYDIDEGITQSMLASYQACKLRSYNQLRGWEFPITRPALFFGSMFHELLEDHYGGRIISSHWIKSQEKKMRKRSIPEMVMETGFAMIEALYGPYCMQYKKEDAKKNWVSLEPTFDVEFNGFRIRGRIDGVFKIKSRLWLLETKTASRIDEPNLMNELVMNFQNLFYIVAAEAIFGQRIAGVLYNVVRKPQLKQKKNEPLHEFARRMKGDVLSRPEFYFHRYEIAYSRKSITEFTNDLKFLLDSFGFWVGNGFQPRTKNRISCTGKYNCEFLQACAQGSMAGYTQTKERFVELT